MCIMIAKMILVIIMTTGAISKSLRQNLSNIPGKHKAKELQKSHIGHSTHSTENGYVKEQNIFRGRNNITCSTNYKYNTAQHYIP
jgi:hypothetical protein